MTITSPQQTPVLLGHDKAVEQFLAAAQSGRMHHAWVIAGPEGIGKTTLAFHIAHHLLSDGRQKIGALNIKDPSYSLIAGDAHPDLRLVSRPVDDKTGDLKNEIPVENIRAIGSMFKLTSAYQGWRVAIISEAEYLNRHGANALLKLLEEPPQRCLIILTVTGIGQLLPTIRSRCSKLYLNSLDHGTMTALLSRLKPGLQDNEIQQAIAAAGGSVGRALSWIDNDGTELQLRLMALLGAAPKLDIAELHAFADQVAGKGERMQFELAMQLFFDWLNRLIVSQAQGTAAREGDLIQRYAARRPLAHWLELWDNIHGMLSAAETLHLDRKLLLINSLSTVTR